MNLLFSRSSLLPTYKSFVRSQLDYGDGIYDQPNNSHFSDKIDSVQYNATLAINGAIRGTSKEKLYQELGLESLKDRVWLDESHNCIKLFRQNYLLICMN